MKTNEIVIGKVKDWLQQENKSYQWLADQLGISKALVGFMLSGERTLLPKRIEQIADVMGISTKDLLHYEELKQGPLTVQLRGNASNRRSKRELEALLFAIEDYVGLNEQVK
ncbi:helix-turn-helix protein [Ureibacillus xyleni]|uniref:Helix-turn-helix protein n=1 Tax=Ureibacillus xyleni TaxID=614648 RepID=A0A285THQ0_9BACL|nr:helix-turn-helix transcriptional regulator [Ureibacillus xyleni]SOC21734.1 helix-turn-helix protein [Ureibacillus xyleni]